jgi:2-keto-4-pentenoate hydratase/2-oxohepta-3-ene-1,7-dioic acid hydratase in catechol pathway
MRIANIDGRAALVQDGRYVDIETAAEGRLPSDPMEVLTRLDEVAGLVVGEDAPRVDESRLGPPVPRPGKVLGLGINYHDHAAEAGLPVPDQPMFFAKLPSAICGPNDEIAIPDGRVEVDWEAELVVVIGRGGRDIPEADVWSHVAGLTGGQDVSDRAEQFRALKQFTMGKSFDTYAPIGPVLVTPDELENPDDVGIRCRLDGEEVQNGRSSDFVFSIEQMISWASRICTLAPGDLFFTGTPVGVGYIRTPPRYLAPGMLLETEIEGIGSLRNPCVTRRSPVHV